MRHLLVLLFIIFSVPVPFLFAADAAVKPNILFIAVDDLRDWTGFLNPPTEVITAASQVKTPNIDRLAEQGVSFTRAYCAAPLCNTSRTALMTGKRPSETGVYYNENDWRKIVPKDIVTLQEHLQQNGYETLGAGKIYHEAFPAETGWNDYLAARYFTDSRKGKQEPRLLPIDLEKNSPYADGVGGIKFAPLDCDDEDMPDYSVAQYGIEQLQKKHSKPFFLAIGFKKPHMPWNVPKKYYDLYPVDKIVLPEIKADDLDDIPAEGIKMAKPQGDHANIIESGRWKYAVQSYLAAISFCDAMLGRLLDAFEKSEYADNTIVVLWSDHGWQLGEKQHWRKFALWEESNRIPLIWKVPAPIIAGGAKAGSKSDVPVDLMHIYPTLADLTGVPLPKHQLSGKSIRFVLENPDSAAVEAAAAETAAISTYGFQNHTVRTKNWRYIRYTDGGEELYNENTDKHEWENLASKPEYAAVKAELAKYLPQVNLPQVNSQQGNLKRNNNLNKQQGRNKTL